MGQKSVGKKDTNLNSNYKMGSLAAGIIFGH
jgi:hypothetical protein